MYLLWVLIDSLCCLHLLQLVRVITFRAVTKTSSCWAYESSRLGTEQQSHRQLEGPQKILKCRGPEMPFPAFSRIFLLQIHNLHIAFVHFHMFQRSMLIVVLILSFSMLMLFPFQCRFFGELFWFLFSMKVAGGHVHNSLGKSPIPGP